MIDVSRKRCMPRWLGRNQRAIALAAVMVAVPCGASAGDFLGGASNKGVFRSATSVLDSRARSKTHRTINLDRGGVVTPTKWGGGESYDGRYRGEFLNLARAAARRHGVPEDLFLRLVQQESGWHSRARSHKGAIGLAQLMPETARRLGVNPHDPAQNLEGGARYLAQQYARFQSWKLALAAYNAGPDAVEAHGGVPPYRETRNYVKAIWGS